jgi:hypothetical protein
MYVSVADRPSRAFSHFRTVPFGSSVAVSWSWACGEGRGVTHVGHGGPVLWGCVWAVPSHAWCAAPQSGREAGFVSLDTFPS